MVTKDEAIKAAEMLKEWCDGLPCKCCPFTRNGSSMGCIFRASEVPINWKIPKPCRWTDTDVELAKALKKAGCIEVHRPKYNPIVLWRTGDYQGDLPIMAFQYLDPGESVTLDTIIQEAKED